MGAFYIARMRVYPDDVYHRFEFERIREAVEQHCRSALAREKALQLQPVNHPDILEPLLHQTHEYLGILRSGAFFPPSQFQEIVRELSLLQVSGATMLEKQILLIRDLCDTANSLIRYLSDKQAVLPALCRIFQGMEVNKDILSLIDEILDPAGEVRSSASKELAEIRKNLSVAKRELDKVFRAQLAKLKKLGWLAETEESVYNGRRVLSVMAEQKRNVKGLIQGSSDTGKTSFIEPIETVDLNNEVFELQSQERREIMRILHLLTQRLRPHRVWLGSAQDALVELDFTRAKAYFARDIDATMPAFSTKPVSNLMDARHPILVLQNKQSRKAVVPLSCMLDARQRMVVISGPNAGGKSIALKTIGLLQLMWQSGLLVPASERSELGIFHRLFADIGDSQSIEYELSTYSSRLARMKYFLEFADRRTLVLIDEFGTGTDPELGGAIAEAILEELAGMKALGVITTHYMNIKLAAERLDGVVNACMQFDDETLMPLFRLQIGQPGSSYTYVIAEKAGLPKAVVERARSRTTSDKLTLDSLLQQLHQQQQELKKMAEVFDEKQLKAEASKQRYDELFSRWKEKMEKKNATAEEDHKLMELGKKLQGWAKEWEASKDKKELLQKITRTFSAEKRKKISKAQELKKEKKRIAELERKKLVIKVGSRVKLLKGKQLGVVEDIQGNKAKVMFGNLKTIASLENLEAVD